MVLIKNVLNWKHLNLLRYISQRVREYRIIIRKHVIRFLIYIIERFYKELLLKIKDLTYNYFENVDCSYSEHNMIDYFSVKYIYKT